MKRAFCVVFLLFLLISLNVFPDSVQEPILIVEVISDNSKIETAYVYVYSENEDIEGDEFVVGKIVDFDNTLKATADFPEEYIEKNKEYIIRAGAVTSDNVYFNKKDIMITGNNRTVIELISQKAKIERMKKEKEESQYQIKDLDSGIEVTNPSNTGYDGRFIGDLEKDALINNSDSNILRDYLRGVISSIPGSYGEAAADVNNDGSINSADYSFLGRSIIRDEYTYIGIDRIEEDEETTLGVLYLNGDDESHTIGYTLEPDWDNNEEDDSCIYAGVYRAYIRAHESSSSWNYDILQLEDVDGRKNIQFHRGNYHKNTKGCILPGTGEGYGPDGYRAVWSSATALEMLISAARKTIDDIRVEIDEI